MQKNTHQHLVYELLKINKRKLYDILIQKCRDGYYHDFKSPIAYPKNQLVIDMSAYPALKKLCDGVIEGDYDELFPNEEISNSAWAKRMLEDGANEELINKFLQ